MKVVELLNTAIYANKMRGILNSVFVNNIKIENVSISTNTITHSAIFTHYGTEVMLVKNVTVFNNSFNTLISVKECKRNFTIQMLSAFNNNVSGSAKIFEFQILQLFKCEVILQDIDIIINEDGGKVFQIEVNGITSWSVKNVTISGSKNFRYANTDLTFFKFRAFLLVMISYFSLQINCPINYNPSKKTQYNGLFTGFDIQLDCTTCNMQQYNIFGGKRNLNFTSTTHNDENLKRSEIQIENPCKPCPLGADCSNRIKSQDNFFGYVENKKTVKFLQCPIQYCCSDKGQQCTSYDTCENNREGILCGSCIDGYYIDFFSNKCSSNNKCTISHQMTFWFTYVLCGAIFGLVLNSMKSIFFILGKKIVKLIKFLKVRFKKETDEHFNIDSIIMENVIYTTGRNMIGAVVDGQSLQRTQETQTSKSDIQEEISFSAIFNIFMSFYQLNELIRVDLSDLFPRTTQIGSVFFNLDSKINIPYEICPKKSLDVIFRDVIKSYIMTAIMLTANLISIIGVWILRRPASCRQRKVRVVYTAMRI